MAFLTSLYECTHINKALFESAVNAVCYSDSCLLRMLLSEDKDQEQCHVLRTA